MKIYLHFSPQEGANSYLVVNEVSKEAVLIDPCKVTPALIEQIEKKQLNLKSVLLTHEIENVKCTGLKTVLKIYNPEVFAPEKNIIGVSAVTLKGKGKILAAGLDTEFFSSDMNNYHYAIYKIGNVVFTGICVSAGFIHAPSEDLISTLKELLKEKVFGSCNDTILMPKYGPPSSIKSEKFYNLNS